MTRRETILRAARFERPERIPVSFHVGGACWHAYPPEALRELQADHPLLFPNSDASPPFTPPCHAPWRIAGRPYTDSWSCVWRTVEDGITGAVIERPLADGSRLADFQPPDPAHQDGWGPIDWEAVAARVRAARERGDLAAGGLRHGHTFLTLTYLRGYENVICDMADDDPRLRALIGMVEEFNREQVRRWLDCGVEWMGYPEDLGMQHGPMISPAHFRKFIKPCCERLVAPARAAGCVIHMHSDGDVRALAADLLDVGIDVLNVQDLVNGIDWLAATLKGRVCIELDLDRQNVTRFGTPAEVDRHVRDAVAALGDPAGGLMLTHGLYPGVPLANVSALMDAMEKYSMYYS